MAAFLSSWRLKAVAAVVWLAKELPATACRARIAEPHTMDGMLVKAMLGQSRARFAPDLAVVYGCLCSHVQLRWPRAGMVWKVKMIEYFLLTRRHCRFHDVLIQMLCSASRASRPFARKRGPKSTVGSSLSTMVNLY